MVLRPCSGSGACCSLGIWASAWRGADAASLPCSSTLHTAACRFQTAHHMLKLTCYLCFEPFDLFPRLSISHSVVEFNDRFRISEGTAYSSDQIAPQCHLAHNDEQHACCTLSFQCAPKSDFVIVAKCQAEQKLRKQSRAQSVVASGDRQEYVASSHDRHESSEGAEVTLVKEMKELASELR